MAPTQLLSSRLLRFHGRAETRVGALEVRPSRKFLAGTHNLATGLA